MTHVGQRSEAEAAGKKKSAHAAAAGAGQEPVKDAVPVMKKSEIACAP